MITKSTIERVNAIPIADVIGKFTTLHRRGARYVGLCPFPSHTDHHVGNFSVYPPKNSYKCFACGAAGGPIDFIEHMLNLKFPDAVRWLAHEFGIDCEAERHEVKFKEVPKLPTIVLPFDMVQERLDTSNDNLCQWLRSFPWPHNKQNRIDKVLAEYFVGHAKQGHTIFWQIDENDQVRTGKMMLYYPATHPRAGHRDKETPYNFDWVHSVLRRCGKYPAYSEDQTEMRQTLFGMHLLNKYPHASVNIVESEKTAIIMAIAWGNSSREIWMACGGKQNISSERLRSLIHQNRKLVFFPDRDAIQEWRERVFSLRYDRSYVNTEPVTRWWIPEDGEKADIADIVLRIQTEPNKPQKQ